MSANIRSLARAGWELDPERRYDDITHRDVPTLSLCLNKATRWRLFVTEKIKDDTTHRYWTSGWLPGG
jgi:hypothetical protein